MTTYPRSLDETIGDLTASLGDPTRRGIYIAVRESSVPMTVSRVAELFDIHANVARHHLDRLVDDDYLRTTKVAPPSGAGRPAKGYRSTDKTIDVHFPSARRDLLNDLLIRLIGEIADPNISAVARSVGRQYGLELASEIGDTEDDGYESAVRAVATAMTGVGFGIAPAPDGSGLLTSHCPFGATAQSHPQVVCSLDQGLVDGLMESINPECTTEVRPHAGDDDNCVTSVQVSIGRVNS